MSSGWKPKGTSCRPDQALEIRFIANIGGLRARDVGVSQVHDPTIHIQIFFDSTPIAPLCATKTPSVGCGTKDNKKAKAKTSSTLRRRWRCTRFMASENSGINGKSLGVYRVPFQHGWTIVLDELRHPWRPSLDIQYLFFHFQALPMVEGPSNQGNQEQSSGFLHGEPLATSLDNHARTSIPTEPHLKPSICWPYPE